MPLNLLVKLFICVMAIIPSIIYGESINNIGKDNIFLLKDDFQIIISQKNRLEKKDKDLYLNIEDASFSIKKMDSNIVSDASIPMVGLFRKKISHAESQDLQELANMILEHPEWLERTGNIDTFIQITQGEQSVSGEFKANNDLNEAIFLKKQYIFTANQMVNIDSYTPITAIQISHAITMANDQMKISLGIKNIGSKKIKIRNPLTLHPSSAGAPHLWYAAALQLFGKSTDLNRPDFSFPFQDMSATSSTVASYIEINPKEEKIFVFTPTQEVQNQIPAGTYRARVLLAMPFDDAGMRRVVVPTDQKKFTKFR